VDLTRKKYCDKKEIGHEKRGKKMKNGIGICHVSALPRGRRSAKGACEERDRGRGRSGRITSLTTTGGKRRGLKKASDKMRGGSD